jgi:hypothetical protein
MHLDLALLCHLMDSLIIPGFQFESNTYSSSYLCIDFNIKTQVASDHVVEEEHVVENMVASSDEFASQRGRLFFKCWVSGYRQR